MPLSAEQIAHAVVQRSGHRQIAVDHALQAVRNFALRSGHNDSAMPDAVISAWLKDTGPRDRQASLCLVSGQGADTALDFIGGIKRVELLANGYYLAGRMQHHRASAERYRDQVEARHLPTHQRAAFQTAASAAARPRQVEAARATPVIVIARRRRDLLPQ